jgi:ribonuclease/clavin/mitogillin
LLTREQNKISQATVQKQLRESPGPNQATKSGYPHEYFNESNDPNRQPLFRVRTNSSTTSFREYPVMSTGKTYDYHNKPKANPGPFRAITNQNKTFKGVISHDGENGKINAGGFHRATEHRK